MKPMHVLPPLKLLGLPRRLARMFVPAALSLACAAALAAAPRDRLTLLVPDGADLNSWQIKVWTDSAAEEGIKLDVIRDAALLALGATAAASISGLVVPDSAHLRAQASGAAQQQDFHVDLVEEARQVDPAQTFA